MFYFPDIVNFLDSEGKSPEMQYAAVLNGRLQATNRHIGCYIDVDVFCTDPEQRKNLEGKIFDKDDLMRLSDPYVTGVIFNTDTFEIITDTENSKENLSRPYTGIVDTKSLKISIYDADFEEYIEKNLKFPDLASVIYAIGSDGQPDIKKVQSRNTHFRGVNLAPSMLMSIANSFEQKDPNYLRLEFFHAQPAKDKVEKPSAAILVSPLKSKYPLYKEMAVIMPVF